MEKVSLTKADSDLSEQRMRDDKWLREVLGIKLDGSKPVLDQVRFMTAGLSSKSVRASVDGCWKNLAFALKIHCGG